MEKAHISSGGGDEVQAVLLYVICDAKSQIQNLLQQEKTVKLLFVTGGDPDRKDKESIRPCSVCLCSPSCEDNLFLSANP